MKVIAFDYDTKQIAWCVIDEGKITTGYTKYNNLQTLVSLVEGLLQEAKPWMIALEGLFLRHNPRVLTQLANIQGILRLAAYRFNACEAVIITPEEAKRGIGIDVYRKPYKGSKSKEKKAMVIEKVNTICNLNLICEHQADAVCVGQSLWQIANDRKSK